MVLPVLAGELARGVAAGAVVPPFDPGEWEIHDSTVVGVALLALLYALAIRLGRRAGSAERLGAWRVVSFLSGLAVLFLAINGPLDDLSDTYLFSAHMVQHLLLTQIVPPLLLLGLPAFALRPLLAPAWVRAVERVLGRPALAFTLYSVGFAAWHLPAIYDVMVHDEAVHVVAHLQFLVTGVILWWPVLSPLPELPRLSSGGAMVYLFLVGLPMMFVAALITLANTDLYPFYAAAPRVWGLSPLDDQKLGGLIMWVPGGLFYWAVMSVIFFRWAAREERPDSAADEVVGAGADAAPRRAG